MASTDKPIRIIPQRQFATSNASDEQLAFSLGMDYVQELYFKAAALRWARNKIESETDVRVWNKWADIPSLLDYKYSISTFSPIAQADLARNLTLALESYEDVVVTRLFDDDPTYKVIVWADSEQYIINLESIITDFVQANNATYNVVLDFSIDSQLVAALLSRETVKIAALIDDVVQSTYTAA